MWWKWRGRQTWATVSRYRKHNRIRGVDWSRLCAAAVFGQINSSRRAIVWKLDRNLFSICPPLELHGSVGSCLRREQRQADERAGKEGRGGAELCNFGRLASLPVILVSRVTPNRADPFGERDVKRWDALTRARKAVLTFILCDCGLVPWDPATFPCTKCNPNRLCTAWQ